MSPDEQALLAAVGAAPADDLPRLAYADWLDEHGRPERAELIRVMVARAAVAGAAGRRLTVRVKQLVRACELGLAGLVGEPEYLYADRRGPRGGRAGGTVTVYGRQSVFGGDPPAAQLARGFVEVARCPAGVWVAAGDGVLARHPVRRVVLTSWPAIEEEAEGGREWFALPGKRVDQAIIRPEGESTVHSCTPAVLAAFWPGVEFVLPAGYAPEEWYYVRDPAPG